MPELPEVEVVARGLRQDLVGDRVRDVEVRWARTVATPSVDEFRRQLPGCSVTDVSRRAKFVVVTLSPRYLLVHLRMSGRLLLGGPDDRLADHRHARVIFELVSGRTLCLLDMRKFGRMYLVDDPEQIVGDLGPEPLDDAFTPETLAELLHGRRRQIKAALLDQRVVAGLGNIYVDEALWQAHIHPLQRASDLTFNQMVALHGAIRRVLLCAIANKGTTFRDYRTPRNEAGQNLPALSVYGRAGESCLRCGREIVRAVMAGRGTHYCPYCQTLPEAGDASAPDVDPLAAS
ncbi:MAG TPA: bifunctional DNA-formamidopyrimidine glycosylase/DNA-(apurinic or apyrimidinic site) lyase [Chloroflexi bacterium]|jgi:formamidopyrimidine-DNA glycosylase|nr:bifunctional DNA-formamidopyrimidine glycosylase/DNA-(apurinic or apyrimidinic site) lyase [Chloroflexota bacterium]